MVIRVDGRIGAVARLASPEHGSVRDCAQDRSKGRLLSCFEIALFHHALMLLVGAFYAVPILAILIGKPPNDFVGTFG
jgi:hypothetical protein